MQAIRWAVAIVLVAGLEVGCGPKPEAEEPAPPQPEPSAPPAKPDMQVPALSSYAWLAKANILIGRPEEKAGMEADLVDFYSGLPNFMTVLAMATKNRSVALRENPAYLTDIWKKYLQAVKLSPDDPPTSLDEFDLGMCKWAIFSAWKIENPYTGVDNYDDAVTSVSYGK